MHHRDSRNTQYNTETTGPTAAVQSRWTVDTGGAVRSSPAVIRGTVYVGSDDGTVYALDTDTGETAWTAETGGPVRSSPAVVDGTVYVGSDDGTVYAFDAETGEQGWTFETGGAVRSSPTVVKGAVPSARRPEWRRRGILVVGSNDGSVYVLDGGRGEKRYELVTDGPVVSTPYVAEYVNRRGRRILWFEVGSTDGHYYGNEPTPRGRASDDAYEANYDTDAGTPIHSSMTTDYNATDGADPFRFGADDGIFRKRTAYVGPSWDFETGGAIRSSAVLGGRPAVLYFGSRDGKVYAVADESGEEEWSFDAGDPVDSSPAVVDGTVYVGGDSGAVYALGADDGTESWTFQTGGPVRSSPAVVDGTVYVGSDDGTVYALSS